MQSKNVVIVLLVIAGLVAGLLFIRVYPPSQYMYVPCLFHVTTGLHCPGCGSTRAVSSLLHGDIGSALKNNLLLFLWMPYVGYIGAIKIRMFLTNTRLDYWSPGPILRGVLIATTILYTIMRNVPVPILNSLLAPIE